MIRSDTLMIIAVLFIYAGNCLLFDYWKCTVMGQISQFVPTRISGPHMPAPEVTILCILPFLR